MSGTWGSGVPWAGPVLRVAVEGVPRPQPRPRMVGRKGGKQRVVSTMEGTPAMRWKRLVLAAIAEAVADAGDGWEGVPSGPVKLRLLVLFPTEKVERWGKLRIAIRNADFDNLAKLVADALTVRRVFGDDGQVAVAEQLHVWAPPERCGAIVEVGAVSGYDVVVPWLAEPSGIPGWLG